MTETTTHGTMTSASDSAAQVQEYVSAVRAALSDLSLEVGDLTAGMDADLGELLAERAARRGRLGITAGVCSGATYRRRVAGCGRPWPSDDQSGDWSRAWSERVSVQMQRRPWLAGLLRGLVAIRPAWWVLRGLIAAWAVAGILGLQAAAPVPRDARMLVLSILGVTGSVALARGPQGSAVTRSLVGLGNASPFSCCCQRWVRLSRRSCTRAAVTRGPSPSKDSSSTAAWSRTSSGMTPGCSGHRRPALR